jgi:hypothetical protein
VGDDYLFERRPVDPDRIGAGWQVGASLYRVRTRESTTIVERPNGGTSKGKREERFEMTGGDEKRKVII